ncbi:MAG: hypothetical protein V2J24_09840 [Pseudomonadales bacterium]|jgi:uncharacterized membrane protein YphA (DoxX/SURF4 family)|nr:hypothetical protein [Pseudomonadales bacterium]
MENVQLKDADYCAGRFQGALRIGLPAPLVKAYLVIIPFVEIGLGLALTITRWRRIAIHGWFAFMATLLFGHQVHQEWSAVNQVLDYFFLGLLCLVLPAHGSWFARDPGPA